MSTSKKSILIVDDMKMVRYKLKQLCGEIGFDSIVEAANGEEALEVLKTVQVDLVLSDWNMPKMTGIELIEKIRSNPAMGSVPVIFITSEDQKENILKSLSAGVTDYIVKPFADAIVKQKIFNVLKVAAGKGTASK